MNYFVKQDPPSRTQPCAEFSTRFDQIVLSMNFLF